MSIATIGTSVSYGGNGVTTAFPMPYKFFTPTDIQVVFLVNGQYIPQAGGFTVVGTNVTFIVAPPVGTTVILFLDIPETQPASYTAQDDFPAATHEGALDRLTMLVQQISAMLTSSGWVGGLGIALVSSVIIGPVGGTPQFLDGLDATNFISGTVVQFTLGGIGQGPAVQYQLTISAAAPGPGIVAALNKPTMRWIELE